MTKIFTVLLLFTLMACRSREREVSIFSIPNDATPSELQANGFVTSDYLSGYGETDRQDRAVISGCDLDLVYAAVRARYLNKDTTTIGKYVIQIDCKPFEKITGFKAKNYPSLEIEGYRYAVKLSSNNLSLELNRLDL